MNALDLDVLIFDMDGVLIDVSDSYRAASCATPQFYFERLLGLAPFAGELISRADVAALKLAGGFNNDWDLTATLVKYFLTLISTQTPIMLPVNQLQITDYLRHAGAQILTTVADLARHRDIPAFARQVAEAGGGRGGARKILGDKNAHLLFADGDLRDTNLVKRIFEEIYLGEELFQQEYGEPRHFVHGNGTIHREKLIANPRLLWELNRRVALGIATGRPRLQAEFALKSAGIVHLFHSMVTLEDVLAAEKEISFSKPHPFSLLQAARNSGSEHARCAYVGDTPDDIRAANAVKSEMNFVSIGCLVVAEDKRQLRREFERAGADVIIEHPDELRAIIRTGAGV